MFLPSPADQDHTQTLYKFAMSCKRIASALLTVFLVISLLAFDHPIAHAHHAKDSSRSTGDSSSTKKGLEGIRKPDVGKTKQIESLKEKAPRGKGAQHSYGSNLGHGGGLRVKSAKVVVVDHHGPQPHPPKHN